MKRRSRIALSALVLVASPILALILAILVVRLIPGVEVDPGFVEATPVHIGAAFLTFVFGTGFFALIGLRLVWDRRLD
jgi:hypothetical protein